MHAEVSKGDSGDLEKSFGSGQHQDPSTYSYFHFDEVKTIFAEMNLWEVYLQNTKSSGFTQSSELDNP